MRRWLICIRAAVVAVAAALPGVPPAAMQAPLPALLPAVLPALLPASMCLLPLPAWAAQSEPGRASLWKDHKGNRYSNRKAMHVGDLITVIVVESSQGTNRSSLSSKKESKLDVNSGPGEGNLDFFKLFRLGSSIKDETDGSGQTSISGQLSTTLTVRVREIQPDGSLVIEGSRRVSVNNDEDLITLHGVARPEDVRADNTILSTRLAEARISYSGKGPAKSAARKGIFQRVFSWIF